MGFWSNVWSGIKSTAKKIDRAVDNAANFVVEKAIILGKATARGLGNAASAVGKSLQRLGGKKPPSLPSNPTPKTIVDTAKWFKERRDDLKESLSILENEVVRNVESFFDEVIGKMSEHFSDTDNARLSYNSREIRKSIKSVISNYLDDAVSLDNEECRIIITALSKKFFAQSPVLI